MTILAIQRGALQAIAAPLPEPRHGAVSIRAAELGGGGKDFAFIDGLQKKQGKAVGFLFRESLEKHIAAGRVLIAEEQGNGQSAMGNGTATTNCQLPIANCPPTPVGYVIASDTYLKREELGVVYQLNVVQGRQRGLIGATLIKEVFHRAAYGCRLFCCWCAQDLAANHFWESMGFLPIAFRTGSRTSGRVGGKKTPRLHIFWQRRIREGDAETPYWFPSETKGGAIGEARIVLPIPPGTHWSDAKPAVLPGIVPLLEADEAARAQMKTEAVGGEKQPRSKKAKPGPVASKPRRPAARGVWVKPPAPPPPTKEEIAAAKKAARQAAKPRKCKNDPKFVAAARELRDRYTEQINSPDGLILPPGANGKYDVSRQLEAAASSAVMVIEQVPAPRPLLEAA